MLHDYYDVTPCYMITVQGHITRSKVNTMLHNHSMVHTYVIW